MINTGNYTIEFFIKHAFNLHTSEQPFSDDYNRDTDGFMINLEYGGRGDFIRYGNYNDFVSYGWLSLYINNSNTWNHFAASTKDGVCRLFVNGKLLEEKQSYYPHLRDHLLCIGGREGGDANCDGYYDEFCISSTGKYTSNFTPPTKPFY